MVAFPWVSRTFSVTMQRYVQLISVAFYCLNWVSRTFSVTMQRYLQLISVAFYCLNWVSRTFSVMMQRYVQLTSVAFYYLNWVSRTFSVMMQRYVQLISVAFYCLICRLIVLHFHVLHLCECLIFNTFRTRFSWTSLSDLQTYLNTSKGFLFVCVWFRFFFVCQCQNDFQ